RVRVDSVPVRRVVVVGDAGRVLRQVALDRRLDDGRIDAGALHLRLDPRPQRVLVAGRDRLGRQVVEVDGAAGGVTVAVEDGDHATAHPDRPAQPGSVADGDGDLPGVVGDGRLGA